MNAADDFLLRFALDRGLVATDALEDAKRAAVAPDGSPAPAAAVLDALAAAGGLDRGKLTREAALHFGLPFVELGEAPIPAELLAALPRSFVLRHEVCPFGRDEAGALRVALADPVDVEALDGLAHVTARSVVPCLAEAGDLRRAIARHFGGAGDAREDLVGGPVPGGRAPEEVPSDPPAKENEAPVIAWVHGIVREAVRRRASDIHLEPLERRFRVRYRIDGVLAEGESPPQRLQLAVVARVKLMAGISIAEKRVPQDGRIQLAVDGRPLDLRVSSLPTAHGESVVLRLLDKEGLRPGLPELGLEGADERAFARLLASPDGIVLVTGPTGSGKTTTLYACLHHLNTADRKIVTVEDPVEYQLTGINQVPVRPEVGMTFASALRAMLRQAPNIVMVGEIRDAETADIAINASLTGHLVFSTLHTNDAPGAVTRLIDIGAKPFLVAASLRAAVAQRLVRRVCRACAVAHAPSASELQGLGVPPGELAAAQFRRGAGCAECAGTGYRGRLGIFELFLITDEIRALIHGNAGATRLRACARAQGMRTMREDGVRKVLAGLTTIEEVLAVTVGDRD